MRIQVFSDIHMEYHADEGREFISALDPGGIDVLIVPGDLCAFSGIVRALSLLADRFRHVVYVPGNHECYAHTIADMKKQVAVAVKYSKALGRDNLHFLDNSVTTIEEQRFVGTTLWFPDHPENVFHEADMDDFQKIDKFRESVYAENRRASEFLEREVREGDVVVTHHLPTRACLSERCPGNLDRFFVSPMDNLIFDAKPALWVHGHTHDSLDFMHGDTRIVCNPFGYAGRGINSEYDNPKIVEI